MSPPGGGQFPVLIYASIPEADPERIGTAGSSSGGLASALYTLKSGETVPHVMELPTQFIATNGIAITPDDRHLFVAAAIDGIARIDSQTNTLEWVESPESIPLTGIDGLEYRDSALDAITNDLQPGRVARRDNCHAGPPASGRVGPLRRQS